jgi:hypothetical protein
MNGVKNPGPKDPTLDCLLRRFRCSFPYVAVCWSDGGVERCKISNSKQQILGCQVTGVIKVPGVRKEKQESRNLNSETLVIVICYLEFLVTLALRYFEKARKLYQHKAIEL